MTNRPFRWAIFGTSAVARKFAFGLAPLGDSSVLAAVASRRAERAASFAASFPGCRAARSYEDALDDDIDGVYIATPPALHEAHAIMALEAGCAALVEKPFATDAASARRIADTAARSGQFCMEAMWTRFLPITAAIKDRIDGGDLGKITGYHGAFQAANVPDPKMSLFDPETGGGALLHRGIYPLSLARHLLGPIKSLQASARIGETGVDEETTVSLVHETGAISSIRTSLVAAAPSGAEVYGTKGTLAFGPIWRPESATIRATRAQRPQGDAGGRKFEGFRESSMGQQLSTRLLDPLRAIRRRPATLRVPYLGNGYTHEAKAVIEGAMAGQIEDPRMRLEESIEILDLIDTARAQFGTGAQP